MNKIAMTALLLGAFWGTGIAQARESKALTLTDAVSQALERNPSIRAAEEKFQETENRISQTFTQLFPTMAANLSATYRKDPLNLGNPQFGGEPYNFYSFGLQFSQPLYAGGALSSALAVARKDREIQALNLAIAKRDLTFNVLRAFYSILVQQAHVETLVRNRELLQDQKTTTEKRHRSGLSKILDVLQVKTELALLEPTLSRARLELEVRAAELAHLLSASEAVQMKVTGELTPMIADTPGSGASGSASVLELERSKLSQEKGYEQSDFQLAKHLPRVDAIATWGRSSYVKSDLLDEYSTSWNVGVQFTLPLFSGLSSIYERRTLRSQQTQLEIEDRRIREQLSMEQIRAQKELEATRDLLEANKTALDYAKSAFAEAKSSYRMGTIDYLRMYQAQKNLSEAEFTFNQTSFNTIIAQAKQRMALGLELDSYVELLAKGKRK